MISSMQIKEQRIKPVGIRIVRIDTKRKESTGMKGFIPVI
jgi:hypothetical protein